ncbi:MAG: FAD-binding protein, partial [Spirochaetales bacterium]|nr:FAD-binding protein [Spirochaetales bacterium]
MKPGVETTTLSIDKAAVPVITAGVAVVGSGAAALNAAVHLKQLGVDDVVLLTENLGGGTSANAGSDKQTYYRLNPTVNGDSGRKMAEDLFSGGCMHGDIALIEASLSIREFYHLVEIGVPFPQNRYGGYAGYQTDNDPAGRGTSAGPKTSILMVEQLLKEARNRGVLIRDHVQIVDLLTEDAGGGKRIAGLLAFDADFQPVVVRSDFVVYGTGGPGALYADSVYPYSQTGSLGIALKAGAKARNLTECQFGIASTGFRWNLSGSYQQVIPRYFSTDAKGQDSRDFLNGYFPSFESQLEAQFLKGYQWPFDVRKLAGHGSSVIDMAVYIESRLKGRKVYLDFRKNPEYRTIQFGFERLPRSAQEYLKNSGAVAGTPAGRLQQMNRPAYEVYSENGIDLETHPIEIAVCHQHCNGGLAGSVWWESNLINFFPVGECCGTHGIYRPGGSALNSGQVGALRTAEMIRYRINRREAPQPAPLSNH